MITDEDIKKLASVFATKEDLNKFVTKEDLNRFATKDDLKAFATKEDLQAMETRMDAKYATKDEIHVIVREIIDEIYKTKTELSSRIDRLENKFDKFSLKLSIHDKEIQLLKMCQESESN